MNRQWFWYPHLNIDAYLNTLGPTLFDLCIKLNDTSSAIAVETDEPRLLDLLRAKRFRDFSTSSPFDEKIPRLTYLHNTHPIKHGDILTPGNILHGSRKRTDISFVPLTSRVLFHKPSVQSMVKDKNLKDSALADFLLAYSFGLVKSLVNGLVSFAEPNGVGCHGAVFELDGKGVALLGGTGSGKSTHALHFLLSNESSILITDDWSIVHYQESDFIATALEQQFFARRAQIEELLKYHPHAIQIEERRTLVDSGSRIDLDLRSILGQNRFAKQIRLDVVVCIIKTRDGKPEAREMEEAEFINFAIMTSPHIPFHSTNTEHYEDIKTLAGRELYSSMVKRVARDTRFWQKAYERLPIYSVSYSDSTPESMVQTLITQVVEAV
jgi:hypothetical protein